LGIINLAAFTFPWIVIAFSRFKKIKAFAMNSDPKLKAAMGFIAIWIIVIIAMSGAVFKFYERYLLPVIPLVSVFFALVLIQTDTRFKKSILDFFIGLNVLVLLVNSLYALFILPDKILIAGSAVGIILLLFITKGRTKLFSPEIILANAILLLYFNVHVLLHPLLMPNPGKQLAETIRYEQTTGKEIIYVYGNIRTASNIRIHSSNRLDVVSMDTIYSLPSNPDHLLVFSPNEERYLNLRNYNIVKGSEEWKRLRVEKFPEFMQQVVRNIKQSGTVYFIAKPKQQ
jgi:hypothetical protein